MTAQLCRSRCRATSSHAAGGPNAGVQTDCASTGDRDGVANGSKVLTSTGYHRDMGHLVPLAVDHWKAPVGQHLKGGDAKIFERVPPWGEIARPAFNDGQMRGVAICIGPLDDDVGRWNHVDRLVPGCVLDEPVSARAMVAGLRARSGVIRGCDRHMENSIDATLGVRFGEDLEGVDTLLRLPHDDVHQAVVRVCIEEQEL